MKKNFAKKTALACLTGLVVSLFASCQDVVLNNIRREVELEDGNVSGDIRSVVRFKQYYYLANGGILFKQNDSNYYGAWIHSACPGGHVIKLAADKNYLYALVGISQENEKEGTNVGVSRALYYSEDGSNWNLVTGVGTDGVIPIVSKSMVYTYLFCTNAINEENRIAYFITNGGATVPTENKAFQLDGALATELELATEDAQTKPCSGTILVSKSCVWYNGKTYFFLSNACATNETTSASATMYYYGSANLLRWGGENENTTGISFSDTISSLAITANYILVGTYSGIKHNVLDDGVPGASAAFANNADATLSSAYRILSLLVVNPELEEEKTAIYASQVYTGNGSSNSAQFDHVGLWAYYPARGNWNRE